MAELGSAPPLAADPAAADPGTSQDGSSVAVVHEPAPSLVSRLGKSVRWRLTLIVMAVVGVTLLLGALLLVKWVESTLVGDLRTRNSVALDSMLEVIGRGSIPSELDLERRLIARADETIDEAISTTYFYIDGAGLENTGIPFRDDDGRMLLFGRAGLPENPSGGYIEVTRDFESLLGPLTLHAVTPRDSIDRSLRALTGALVLGLPLLVIAAGAMTWGVAGRTLAPVAAMTRRVRELSATNLDARVPVPPSGDEIAELADTMNEMLERLERSSDAQRQFVSDASHELRSPVASIRAQLETALRYPDDVDWPQVARVVLTEDDRLDHLVGNLLAMARLEEGRRGPRTEVDVEDLVLAQTHRFTDVAVDVSAVSAGRVWGNSGELTSVVRNLTDNAARHAESQVRVSLREEGPWVVLRVADDGEGVLPAERERIFERFARLEEGRTRDRGGAGLGLALSKRIVEQHGGRIHVEDRPGGGAAFVVSLPSAGWTPPSTDPLDRQSAAPPPISPGTAETPSSPESEPAGSGDSSRGEHT